MTLRSCVVGGGGVVERGGGVVRRGGVVVNDMRMNFVFRALLLLDVLLCR